MTERKPEPKTLTLEQFESYWALIERRMTSGAPRSVAAEYCQRMARAIEGYKLEVLTSKKKLRAKAAPRGKAFGGSEEVAIACEELARRDAKLLR